jgi:hypothetical protein
LKDGLSACRDECSVVHPAQGLVTEQQFAARSRLQEQVYGTALVARASIEEQVLGRCVWSVEVFGVIKEHMCMGASNNNSC